MQDELIASYLTVLNESNESEVKGATPKSGSEAFGDFKEGNDSTENVDLDNPKEDKDLSSDTKSGEPKAFKESKISNPFDDLYNKLVKENSFSFSTEDENEITPDGDFESEETFSDEEPSFDDELGGDDEFGDLENEEENEEVNLSELVSTLKSVLSQLEMITGEEEEEIDDIEDLDDEDSFEEEEEESEDDDSEDDGDENPFKEGYREKQWEKENRNKKKKKKNPKFEKFEKGRGNKRSEDLTEEAVKVTGLKKGCNLKPFKGNIKTLQNKKAEVANNNPKASKGKAQTPATGKGYDGVPTKLSPSTGHNLMKPSSHTVQGAVKQGKGLFDQ